VDLNGDGKLDLVLVNFRTEDYSGAVEVIHGNLTVLVGKGDGTFLPARTRTLGDGPRSLTVGDWNGDGKPDLAVVEDYGQTNMMRILLGRGDATFEEGERRELPYGAAGVMPVDIDKDGKLDLMVWHSGFSLYLGNGDGTFREGGDHYTDLTRSVAVADFDGDGKLDVAAVRRVFLGDGQGGFPRVYSLDNPYADGGVAAADLNGDGRPDLIVGDRAHNQLSIYLNSGAASPALSLARAR
jgi:hypothetical protein